MRLFDVSAAVWLPKKCRKNKKRRKFGELKKNSSFSNFFNCELVSVEFNFNFFFKRAKKLTNFMFGRKCKEKKRN